MFSLYVDTSSPTVLEDSFLFFAFSSADATCLAVSAYADITSFSCRNASARLNMPSAELFDTLILLKLVRFIFDSASNFAASILAILGKYVARLFTDALLTLRSLNPVKSNLIEEPLALNA